MMQPTEPGYLHETAGISWPCRGRSRNEHIEEDGPTVFARACKLGLKGFVSKRRDSSYRSGRSPHGIKSKNPNAPAVKREVEEEWGRWSSAKTRRSSP
jgi:ATP-dependent DNA ligase